ncbi:MAG: serine/threonine protein kinase, partial [Acidobacteria bacterium]|nr:serine/threonine protein kinase [Acidobacteriota bacterium]
MPDYHSFYRLGPMPLGTGGQAEVFRAEHRLTGTVVALKRRNAHTDETRDRMRREIEVQSAIQHLNVMPILDYDADGYEWFTMPIAVATLTDLALPLETSDLTGILRDASLGLQAAHSAGFIHRDIKPNNVLRLDDPHGRRWVVSDWGIVRRRDRPTTARHTQPGTFLGTEGFAPPEAYGDAHAAAFSWDSYSLGRLAAWASTGDWPTPLNTSTAPEPWRRFVRLLTDNDPSRRPQDMARVVELLSHVTTGVSQSPGVPAEALGAAKAGDSDATIAVLNAALEYEDDADFFIDDIAEVSGPGLEMFVRQDPPAAKTLLRLMDSHLEHIVWGRRDFNHYNVPLYWMQRMAQAAAEAGELDLFEDACAAL